MDKNSLLTSPTTLSSDAYTDSQKNKFKELIDSDRISLMNGSMLNLDSEEKGISESVLRLSNFNQLDENDLFIELIRDVANELDINILCHKILRNVGLLTNSDRGSLFLTKGTHSAKLLVSTLYDVTAESTLAQALHSSEQAIVIPWGKGIAGHVAATKETINIKNAYKDARFNPDVDKKTGYHTHSILCMPIMNYEGEVVGVAQIINKRLGSTQEFTEKDQEVFRKYLMFCGIGIQNARLFEISIQEYKRNKLLLKLARNIFEQQNTLEELVPKIMRDTQEIIKADCCIYIIHKDFNVNIPVERPLNLPQQYSTTSYLAQIQFCPVFKLFSTTDGNYEIKRLKPEEFQDLPETQIALYVVVNGETLVIRDGICETTDIKSILLPTPDDEILQTDGSPNKSNAPAPTLPHFPPNILTVPIMNNDNIVFGAVQFIHENDQPFQDSDVALIEAFALFCGLGINNTSMYENVVKLIAKQNVALEVLSYHATASPEEVKRIKSQDIPSVPALHLDSFAFDDKDFTDNETILASLSMFYHLNLPAKFNIPLEILTRWALSVKKNYRNVTYHNWRHAFNVAQVMFCILTTGGLSNYFSDLEIFAFLVACLCHDLDHRGTNNAFMTKADTSLAKVYGTSTLEHHHFDQCIMILNSPGNTILQSLSPSEYRQCIELLEHYILATDLAIYFKRRPTFIEMIDKGEKDFNDPEDHALLSAMMMTACDIAAITKPWPVQQRIGVLVAKEFFEQGDIEKNKLHMQPLPLMDRNKAAEMPKMQVDFINVVCLPVYEALAKLDPKLKPLLNGVIENRNKWQELNSDPHFNLNSFSKDPVQQANAFLYNDNNAASRGSVIEENSRHLRGIRRDSIMKLTTSASALSLQSSGAKEIAESPGLSPLNTGTSKSTPLTEDISEGQNETEKVVSGNPQNNGPETNGITFETREQQNGLENGSSLNNNNITSHRHRKISKEIPSLISNYTIENSGSSNDQSIDRLSSEEEKECQNEKTREALTRLLARQSASPTALHFQTPITFKGEEGDYNNSNSEIADEVLMKNDSKDHLASQKEHDKLGPNGHDYESQTSNKKGIFRRSERISTPTTAKQNLSSPAAGNDAKNTKGGTGVIKHTQFSSTPPLTLVYPGNDITPPEPRYVDIKDASSDSEGTRDEPASPIEHRPSRLLRHDSLQMFKAQVRRYSHNLNMTSPQGTTNDTNNNKKEGSVTTTNDGTNFKKTSQIENDTDRRAIEPGVIKPHESKTQYETSTGRSPMMYGKPAKFVNRVVPMYRQAHHNNLAGYSGIDRKRNVDANGNKYRSRQSLPAVVADSAGSPNDSFEAATTTTTTVNGKDKNLKGGGNVRIARRSLPLTPPVQLLGGLRPFPHTRHVSRVESLDVLTMEENERVLDRIMTCSEDNANRNNYHYRDSIASSTTSPIYSTKTRKRDDDDRDDDLSLLSKPSKTDTAAEERGVLLSNAENSKPIDGQQRGDMSETKLPSFEDQRIELGGVRRSSKESYTSYKRTSLTPDTPTSSASTALGKRLSTTTPKSPLNNEQGTKNLVVLDNNNKTNDEIPPSTKTSTTAINNNQNLEKVNEDIVAATTTQQIPAESDEKSKVTELEKSEKIPDFVIEDRTPPPTLVASRDSESPEKEKAELTSQINRPNPSRLSQTFLASDVATKIYENDDYDNHKLRRSSKSSLFNRGHKKSDTSLFNAMGFGAGETGAASTHHPQAESANAMDQNPEVAVPSTSAAIEMQSNEKQNSDNNKDYHVVAAEDGSSPSNKPFKLSKPPPGKSIPSRKNEVSDGSKNNSNTTKRFNDPGGGDLKENNFQESQTDQQLPGSKVHFESLVYKPRHPSPSPLQKFRKPHSKICTII